MTVSGRGKNAPEAGPGPLERGAEPEAPNPNCDPGSLAASGSHPRWRLPALAAPILGGACFATLIWALNLRLDRWDASAFVLLIYGSALSAVVGSVAAWKQRNDPPLPESIEALRQMLWLAVVIAFLWVWVPPVQDLVGWAMRQASMFRFS